MTAALDDFYVTTETAAQFLGEKVTTLHTWRHRQVGPPSYVHIGRVKYRWSELTAWAAERDAQTKRGGVAPRHPAADPKPSPAAHPGPLGLRDGSVAGPSTSAPAVEREGQRERAHHQDGAA